MGALTSPATMPAASRSPAQSYDFSAVSQLPLQRRPNTNETLALRPDSQLLRDMNADRANFYRLRYLLPETFRLGQGVDFQPILDDAILTIASTEAGKKAICVFSADSANDVGMYFQVTDEAAAKIRRACAGRRYPPAVLQRLRVMREVRPPLQPVPMVPAKRFVFVFSESGRPAIEGYTTKNNTTYLILSRETMNPAAIQRLIAHEIAMGYDQLSRLGYLLNPETIEDMGVGLAFGKSPTDPKTFTIPTRAELNRMRCAFRDPALRYAASVQRAFKFEDAVAAEAGGSSAVATAGTCGQVLARNSVLLQAMSSVVAFDTGWYGAACGLAKTPAARVSQIVERIRDIEATKLPCADRRACGGRASLELCELLLNPRIGPYAADLDGGGPRPSIGGGWIDSRANLPLAAMIERASAGAELTPAELRKLGGALQFKNMDELYDEEDRLEHRRTGRNQ